jgi:hypothetical protein
MLLAFPASFSKRAKLTSIFPASANDPAGRDTAHGKTAGVMFYQLEIDVNLSFFLDNVSYLLIGLLVNCQTPAQTRAAGNFPQSLNISRGTE